MRRRVNYPHRGSPESSGTVLDSWHYMSLHKSEVILSYFFQAWSVPEVLRPLYESSKAVAQKMTIAVSGFLLQPSFIKQYRKDSTISAFYLFIYYSYYRTYPQ